MMGGAVRPVRSAWCSRQRCCRADFCLLAAAPDCCAWPLVLGEMLREGRRLSGLDTSAISIPASRARAALGLANRLCNWCNRRLWRSKVF